MGAHPPTTRAVHTAGDPGSGLEGGQSQDGLQAGLKNRHLSMIAIGGVIGAGLFVGSGAGIAAAGPGILLSYALTGLDLSRPDPRLLAMLQLRLPPTG